MAESAVSFLFNQLDILLREERQLLKGIGKNAVYIRDELEQKRAFLRAADAREESDDQLLEWVKQVREITHDTEDVLAMYMLRFTYQRHDTSGLKRYIKNMYAKVKNLRARHQIASEFQEIRLRLENVSKSRERFKDVYNDLNGRSSNKIMYDTRGDALLLEEAEVVGIEKPKKQLLDWLMQSDDGLKVISVVGMGGLGKTTLVKKIYDDALVKANFKSHAFITVSENFNLEHLLRDMIDQLAKEIMLPPPQNLEAMTADQMKEYVYKHLQDKAYVVVLDDVWKVDTWESIRYTFPRTSVRGSIIITTRLFSVGNAACCETNGHLYHLNPLTPEKSEELFYRKAFPRNSCPPYLTEISKSILERCEGLPLAIVVIGRLLATKNNNLEDWKMFDRTIALELQGDSLKRLNRLLSLSYYDLPYRLKACFLYLSIFPEDVLILKWKIIRLWIAEGFVETKDGKSQEEVAESYLNELLNRSLIQVADIYNDGRPRKFRIHDILRNFIISKSIEQNLVTLSCGEEMTCKVRRMAIHNALNNTKECYNVQYLRSFFWLESEDSESGPMFQKVLGGKCRLLKVLDIRGAPIDSIPTEVFELYCLKYLSLRRTNIQLIPKSIGNLRNLETLDLKKSKVTELPVEILKLQKLRHLLVYSYGDVYTFHCIKRTLKVPYEIGRCLTSLQKLCFIDADEADGIKIVREIGKLTQLRRLGITKLRREDGKDLCSSLGKLTKLRTLYILSNEEDAVLDLDHSLSSSSSPLPFLRKVYLQGRLEKFPQWVYSLDGLTELEMCWSRFREDPLRHFGVLPNLVFLSLATLSYEGEELLFKDKGFQKLETLALGRLRGLRRLRVEKGSMPHLEELIIRECGQMEELPEGIEHLSNLKIVGFYAMSEKFNMRLAIQKNEEGVGWKLAHVSQILVWSVVNGKVEGWRSMDGEKKIRKRTTTREEEPKQIRRQRH